MDKKIRDYIKRYRFLEMQKRIKEGFFLSVATIVSFVFVTLLLEHIFSFGMEGIFVLRLIFLMVILLLLFRCYYNVVCWKKFSYEKLTILIEERLPEFNTHLINSWQLKDNKVFPYPFTELLKQKTVGLIQKVCLEKSLDTQKLTKYKKFVYISLFLLISYLTFYHSYASKSFVKLFVPFKIFSEIIKVEPGNSTVEKGAPFEIYVYLKDMNIIPFVEMKNGEVGKEKMVLGKGFYLFKIPSVTEDFYYRIVWDTKSTVWYKVEVKNSTILSNLFITYDFPAYTGLKKIKDEKLLGEISALYGTKITIETIFSNPVEDVSLQLGINNPIKGRGKGKRRTFSFYADNATLYRFKYYDPLSSKYKVTNKERFNVVFDRSPYIEFAEPGRDIYLKGGGDLAITLKGKDDFGITLIKVRRQINRGDVSDKDPLICQFSFKGKKEVIVSHTIKTPENFALPIFYYAECLDNSPSGNKGFTSIYSIYPLTKRRMEIQAEQKKFEEEMLKQAETLKSALKQFVKEEKKVLEATKRLDKREDRTQGTDKINEMIETQNRWKELFQKILDDLNKISTQTKGQFTLAEELVEMISHIQSSEEQLKKQALHLVISATQSGLELAEEITSNLEKWLAEIPDFIKWEMEEPKQKYDVPEAALPEELEDIIGKLIEQEEDMKEEIEDITSSWMDSLDKGAGWGTLDGPISNMSAKGVTGNLMPNQQEVGGRSGEGRSGRSYGEMVEKTATGKGGRKTPARLTPDNLEPGEIEDLSQEVSLGPTGGGKISGWGPEGLEGLQPGIDFKYDMLAEKQQKIIEKTERVIREMKVLNVYNPQLEKALSGMKDFHIQLKEGRYKQGMLTQKNLIISHLKEADTLFLVNRVSMAENRGSTPKSLPELGGVWDEKVPTGYENMVKKYYREIYKK